MIKIDELNLYDDYSYISHMITKEKLISAINRLPDKFSMDDVLDELFLIQKIENGLEQSKLNDIVSDTDLEKELPEWLN